ncbi:terminase small subunit [Furfurilactobacillus entadae]|uniref:terminase small subunit n=1 Tax=Furfurilactobacillus entadae TaxID=2922307 RepID=UPI0035E6A96F
MVRKLTDKQRIFAEAYVKEPNATKAAISAGYSQGTARSIGAENLTKPDIKEYITEMMDEMASERIMDSTEAIELLTRIARGEETETVFVPTIDGGAIEKEKEADIKTRITAVKEILKRYPGSDERAEAELKKLSADARQSDAKARIAEHEADEIEGKGATNPLLTALSTQATSLIPEEDNPDEDTTD